MDNNIISTDKITFQDILLRQLKANVVSHPSKASLHDWSEALSHTVRELVANRFIHTMDVHHKNNAKRVYYLSMEYLVGRLTEDTMINLGVQDYAREVLADMGVDLDDVLAQEPDMGLGNGGLGRLAACFLDSMATLEIPAVGYGINYEFGLFRQSFKDGRQVESADEWRSFGCPWQIVRPEITVEIPFGGHIETVALPDGTTRSEWIPESKVLGVANDIPVQGYGVGTVNFLRLWAARASKDFDFHAFDSGCYSEAVKEKVESETISKILYPNDNTESGKKLRLLQEYFFVACSIADILRRHLNSNPSVDNLSEKLALHINDTHPAIAVAELMRVLLDTHGLDWDKAWAITERSCAYTNHTLMPEALERWSVALFETLLPRHLEIIRGIDERFRKQVGSRWPDDEAILQKLSIIDDKDESVRMAHLAIVGSHSVNGVAALHSELLRKSMFPEMDSLFPTRFNNKTNGITPRRWIRTANPALSCLIDKSIGTGWTRDLEQLARLEPLSKDESFKEEFRAIKQANKVELAKIIKERCSLVVDPAAMFDVQIKRLHEYKRQHLNLLHIVHLYRCLLDSPGLQIQPRVFIFGAKAAPGYVLAKHIIHAINLVADVVNNDPRTRDMLKVAFLPNYNVSLAQRIIPAADLSEQISTAGLEASGTGNMKLALNGALTIGTLDGANVEIRDNVGAENIFIFGHTADEIAQLRQRGAGPVEFIKRSADLRAVLDLLASGAFCRGGANPFVPLLDSITGKDPFFVCADFDAYCLAQSKAALAYENAAEWTRKAILNVARCGAFSSDRTIRQYAEQIWDVGHSFVWS
ncbi:MAG: glycogen/starch/alpha-glucan phosphorylase [Opitutales bacterium]|nr:glycogen/starch/alpha-glucan phosphorylase [Opitutales bacterium]